MKVLSTSFKHFAIIIYEEMKFKNTSYKPKNGAFQVLVQYNNTGGYVA